MYVLEVHSGIKISASVEKVTPHELKGINKQQFEFDWNEEKSNEVYKLQLHETGEIVGLLSLIEWEEEKRIEIHLIESSIGNVGKTKKYDRIAVCLIGFACGISFERGYFGFISLIPKTQLRRYYIEQYGMEEGGLSIFSDTPNSAI